MTQLDHRQLAEALLPAVLSAGAIQMRYYRDGVAIDHKDDSSPVTAADRDSEVVLVEALERAAHGMPVVAEEAMSAGAAPDVSAGGDFFLVDPLDGTREFINKRDEFTINIGLISGRRPVFGIVYAPALSDLYITLGAGEAVQAKVDPGSAATRLDDLALEPIRARQARHGALVALASRSHRSAETDEFLARYAVDSFIQAGSSLKFCVVARGDADLYPRLGPTCEWDTAAGHAVLSAAGGSVTMLDGAPLQYGKSEDRWLNPFFVAWGQGGPLAATA